MSHTETHIGKLRKVPLKENQTIEQWCEEKCKELNINFNYGSWEKTLLYNFSDDKYFIIDDTIWEVFDHTEVENNDDIDIMTLNEDGTLSFVMQFYNGGTCLSECIEDGIKRIEKYNGLENYTDLKTKIEAWWDNLNDDQQSWLENKFYKDDVINTIDKVIYCYNSLTKDELLTLSGIKNR